MPQMRAADIVGWSLRRKANEQRVTTMQKFCMLIVGGAFAYALTMVSLETFGVIQEDVTYYKYMMLSIFSAGVGYLFGNNARTSMSSGEV